MRFKYNNKLTESHIKIFTIDDTDCQYGKIKTSGRMLVGIFFLTLFFSNCKKLVRVDPPTTSITGSTVYTSDATAAAVLTGIYTRMSSMSNYGNPGITGMSLFCGLSADELILFAGSSKTQYRVYYRNELSINTSGSEYWRIIYPDIFKCNSAIEGLNNSTALTPEVKQQLIGEAKFMRAFFYFYLVGLYGDVPLLTTTDYKVNASLERTSKAQVYQQIINDLKDAQNLLSSNYLKADVQNVTTERVRPTKWAAKALLARVYLYIEDWSNAETEASSVIDNSFYKLTTLNNAFLKNSTEAIWQLQPVNGLWNTEDAKLFIIPNNGLNNSNPVYLSNSLLNSFETDDKRKTLWIGKYTDTVPTPDVDYYYPYKYKINTSGSPVTESLTMLRLAEQYLIRAEARVQKEKFSDGASDLNVIRARAGLGNTSAISKTALLTAIHHERQVELFTELGQRWFELKRTNNIDAVMSVVTPLKANGASWQSYQQLYPIPIGDIEKNPNIQQNTGY